MLKTNREVLLSVAVVGEVTHTSVESMYLTSWDGKPIIGLGRGGIVYNVKVGDPCFGWAWGEKVEPGVSADGIGSDGEKGSFRNLSCVGNEAKVIDGEAKGAKGTVVGKVGYLMDGAHHVVMHFDDKILENLAIGNKIQVKALGVGLRFLDFPEVRAVGLSPQILDAMDLDEMDLDERDGKIIVPVTRAIPAAFVGQGSGGAPAESSNWDVMTQSPDAIEFLRDLRLGDIVMLEDILSAWGRGYYEGGATVGVVSCGSSHRMGQGIGVTTLFTSKNGELKPQIDPDANIRRYLNLG